MDRRKFIKASCAFCGTALAGAALMESCSKKTNSVNLSLDLNSAANTQLNAVGGYVYNSSIIIARIASPLASSSFVALAQQCTHDGCNVSYASATSSFNCPCHAGKFDTSGKVIAGPPPSPLTKYNTSLSGNTLTITS